MAHIGFQKLEAMMKKGGAKNPAGDAASVMHKKYKQKDITKHQQAGTSMKNVKPKKTYG